MFERLPEKFSFPESEQAVLSFWKSAGIFGKSLELRRAQGAPRFVFYEGPPTANGMPHPGHCLTRAMKDLFPRYQTMCGKLVERKAGWDTHGLPVEVEVCKELGIHAKEEIEQYGLEPFVHKCVESVWRYTREWEYMTSRLGFWINLDEAYATYHQYYVESVWWSLKTLFERGLLYQGHKVVWWWAQGGTALSAGEVGEGYRTVDDPSVFVKFPLVGGAGILPANGSNPTGGADILSAPSGASRDLETRQRRLPHWEAGGSSYFITFRTSGVHKLPDGGVRSSELTPDERDRVLEACLHFHADRLLVHAVVVMPDHVHLLITPIEKERGTWWSLSELLHSIKSFSANQIGALRRQRDPAWQGSVWQDESFDRIIRNEADFQEKQNYILANPAKRGLDEDYPWLWDERAAGPLPTLKGQAAAASEEGTGRQDACPPRVSLLVWTTTPWTLISNHFAAVHPDLEYALVEDRGFSAGSASDQGGAGFEPAGRQDACPTQSEYLYIARDLVETVAKKVRRELKIIGTCKGRDLIGLRYVPPFDDVYYAQLSSVAGRLRDGSAEPIGWRVVAADFVTIESGTGVVHEAPAYGEVDFDLLQDERKRFEDFDAIPLLNAVAPNGTFNEEAPERYRGRWVKDCDKDIIRELRDERRTPWGTPLLFHQEVYRHEYPFCPRAEDDALIQYARKSWFVRTSAFKDAFLANNALIRWLPEHIRDGRFGDFLRNNVDWALSRERYWGTPLPIWVCEKTGQMEAVGSYAELLAKPGVCGTEAWEQAKAANPDLPDDLRVHRPYIDAITYDSPFAGDGGGQRPRMRRVKEVIDCWWDAGSMPFAQWGFPHAPGSVERTSNRFPADFISEAIDQTRGWFYALLAINTLLFGIQKKVAPGSMASDQPTQLPPVSKGGAGVSPAAVTQDLNIRYRRKLPHWEAGGSTYFVTFRVKQGELSPAERSIVLDACLHWHGVRCRQHAIVVMPDHVHMIITPLEQKPGVWWSLSELMHSIKGFSAHKVMSNRGMQGTLWQDDRYDRIIRMKEDYEEKLVYIIHNPVNKGFGEDYQWLWLEECSPTSDGGRDARPTLASDSAARNRVATDDPAAAVPGEFPLPYRTCIVLGHMMGEDGLKMSKRKKNYREPSYVFDHYGADAMRWYFYSAQTPWTSVRFTEAAIRDAQREFLVRLYNVFSFFNIYANIDGFEVRQEGTRAERHEGTEARRHGGERRSGGDTARGTGWRAVGQRCELDRWIISELHLTTRFVRESMDRFENFPAAGRLNEFVDALSNWYVRRSRERFWRSLETPQAAQTNTPEYQENPQMAQMGADNSCAPGPSSESLSSATFAVRFSADWSPADQDKWDAYNTLYEVLVTLSKLIAPFTPFFAETMYQNLVAGPARACGGDAAESVHLCDYPAADAALIDVDIVEQMGLVREVASLGRAARTAAKIKVRQPLAQVEIILARPESKEALARHADLIAEELNVKRVDFTEAADHYVTYDVRPNFKAIGPKHGKLAPQIAKALKGLPDAAGARRALVNDGVLAVDVAGQRVELTPEEVEIRLEAKPGWSAAQGRVGVVVLNTELTAELRAEGLVRELIHHVQNLRKQQQLKYEARIDLWIEADAELVERIRHYADTLRDEVLARRIEFAIPAGREAAEVSVEGHKVRLAVGA